jgi:hypothetical protein
MHFRAQESSQQKVPTPDPEQDVVGGRSEGQLRQWKQWRSEDITASANQQAECQNPRARALDSPNTNNCARLLPFLYHLSQRIMGGSIEAARGCQAGASAPALQVAIAERAAASPGVASATPFSRQSRRVGLCSPCPLPCARRCKRASKPLAL